MIKKLTWLLSFCAGTILGMIGFAVLGVPADLPAERWVVGLLFLGAAIIVWERLV